ncbi:hypothetical protein [Methyloversatilis discipulorum]|uniref:hypothetical protein n=1 Tax=Methyloversatilis discipulorum TaxID=1119528 RepID=UPI0031382DD9
MTPRRHFARLWMVTLTLSLAAVALFNAFIDPWGLHGLVRIDGVNAVKIRPERAIGELKLARALRHQPDALILGNSRADIDLDPAHDTLTTLAQRPFNLAEPGAALTAQVHQLEALLEAGHRPRLLLVGLELFDLLNAEPLRRTHWRPRDDLWAQQRATRLQSVITLSALGDSLLTLRAQRDPYAATLRDDGFNPLRDYDGMAAREGYAPLFRQRAAENARRIGAHRWPSRLDATADFIALRRLLELADQHDMRVECFTYPYHAHILGTLHRAGLMDEVAAWKQALADTVHAAAAQGANVRLWDFVAVTPETAEAVPSPGDRRSVTRWYWEGGHFKAALGHRMLERMLGTGGTEDFGRPLPPEAVATDTLARDVEALLAARADLDADLDRAFAIAGLD